MKKLKHEKIITNLILIAATAILFTSCYTNTMIVGQGAQTGVEVKAKKSLFD